MKWTPAQMPRLDGKVAIVTGASNGIGYFTALELARKGAEVILACRSEALGKETEEKISQEISSSEKNPGKALFMKLDLSDLNSVQTFSKEFHSKYQQLDLLINNAGIAAPPFGLSKDGFEMQFATNHLGHFALTSLLFDLLKQTKSSRVVNVSSNAHKGGNLDFENIPPKKETYQAFPTYSMTKLANLLFTNELQRRLNTNQVNNLIAVACHPGFSLTNIAQGSVKGRNAFVRALVSLFLKIPLHQTAEMGALPTLYAATAENVKGGEYYGPDGFHAMWGYPALEQSSEASHNEETAKKLWELSEKLTKVHFEFIP